MPLGSVLCLVALYNMQGGVRRTRSAIMPLFKASPGALFQLIVLMLIHYCTHSALHRL